MLAALAPHDVPDWIAYLRVWFYELHRTRGYDMNGAIAFNYPMVESWAHLTHRAPTPADVDALFACDQAFRFPEPTASAETTDATAPAASPRVSTPTRPWPSKKTEAV